jgi:magnesium transporter
MDPSLHKTRGRSRRGRRRGPPAERRRPGARLFDKRRFSRPGTAPGTLHPPAERRVAETAITVHAYTPDGCTVDKVRSVADLERWCHHEGVVWVDVVGLHDLALVQEVGERFGLHPLALEDAVNLGQRPKADVYGEHLFVVLRLPDLVGGDIATEQLSLFFSARFVITFQEIAGDPFAGVRDRLCEGRGRLRRQGGDYLAYALLDAVVDHYFPILETLGERLEDLEERVIAAPTPDAVSEIHRLRRDLLLLRRAAWPQREVVSRLERDDSGVVTADTKVYLRDLYDHAIQILDLVESYRELAAGLLDVYLSSLSNRMNEVMKVLTIIATIFIPLGFIAGVYGMNFDRAASPWNMPELGWAFGYPMALGLMAAVGFALLAWFWRKGWL